MEWECFIKFVRENNDCLDLLLSSINIIAVFVVAWFQYKIQQQQINLQKQEYYKDLYCFVNSIYYALHGVKSNVLNNIYSVLHTDSKIKRLKDHKGAIEELRTKLYAHEMEFNLKLKTKFDFYTYNDALEHIEKVYNRIIIGLENKTLKTPNDLFGFNGLASDDERFNTLLSSQSKSEKEKLEKLFTELDKYKDKIQNSGVLEILKKHCNID